jgi:hypothetical protein
MLSDAQIERHSRQILLPEVGGRGQERLLAARICVTGTDEAAGLAALLLGRAGVGTLDLIGAPPVTSLPPECRVARYADAADVPVTDVIVDLEADPATTVRLARRAQGASRVHVVGVRKGARIVVATLVGRPCAVCLADDTIDTEPADPGTAFAAPATFALGALAAAEALRALCLPVSDGRVYSLDLATGACSARMLIAGPGCAVCGGSA